MGLIIVAAIAVLVALIIFVKLLRLIFGGSNATPKSARPANRNNRRVGNDWARSLNNPANPNSPLNINNPLNPANPARRAREWANNPANPMNPNSPMNPINRNRR